MWIAKTIARLHAQRQALGGRLVLVPTMGALHEGHQRHIETARRVGDHVIVSIFVNPTQFGPDEDFDGYPRDADADCAQCEKMWADGVFYPTVDEMCPPWQAACQVTVAALGDILEGRMRPGHFAGVCRVVTKLLHIVQPHVATFGYKDYQQLAVVRALVGDLNLPVVIEPIETVRQGDGLAVSSRNTYLSAVARGRAVGLYQSLTAAKTLVEDEGEADPQAVESAMLEVLKAHQIDVDYAVLRHPTTLGVLDGINPKLPGGVVALVAGRFEGVRLIDSMVLGAGDLS